MDMEVYIFVAVAGFVASFIDAAAGGGGMISLPALLLTGIEAGFLKKVIVLSSPVISFYLWCFSGALFSFVLLILFRKGFEKVKTNYLKDYIIVATCLGIMQLSTNYVFDNMNVGFALALFQLSTLVSLFLGFKMFHEKDMTKKIIGTIVMIVGSILVLTT